MSLHAQGLRAWLWQRLTSIYISLFVIVAGVAYLLGGPLDYEQWRSLLACLPVNIATALFVMAVLFHAGVGVRDILVDYIHSLVLRFAILVILLLMLLVLGVWSMWILISVVAV